jgi:2-aminoethylphosphonate-pyruvate transaminase
MLLLTGSGTAAMEMAVSSVVPEGKKILTMSNGAFGERLGEIARLHNLPHVSLSCPWGTLPDPAALEAMLIADPEIAVVAMIHHETSIGVVNPVGAVGRICRARSVTLVVDAVSSLGAEDLDVVRDNIDVCFSSANKCLHSVSGVSFVCVAPTVWPRIADIPPRVYYLDLKRYRRYLTDVAQTPFTPAVSSFFALKRRWTSSSNRAACRPGARPIAGAICSSGACWPILASNPSPTPGANRTPSSPRACLPSSTSMGFTRA